MEKVNNPKKVNDTSSATDIVFDYLRYWKWFIVSVAVCLFAGAAIILVTQKQYKTSLSILLNEDKSKGGGIASFDLEALGLQSTTSNIENEIAILSSPDLMQSVADSLNLQTTYYVTNRFRKYELYGESPFYVGLESADKAKIGHAGFYIQQEGTEYEVKGTYENKDIDEKLQSLPAELKLDEDVILNIQLTGKNVIDGEKYHVQVNNINSTALSLCSELLVSPTTKSSSVLNVSITGNNTRKGAAVLRELVKQYNELDVKVKNEIAYNTAIFINDRLKDISVELGSAEADVVSFKQKNRIANLSVEGQMFIQQAGENEQKLMDVETQLNIILWVERFVNDPANRYAVIPNIGISDAGLIQIINEYNTKLLASEVQLKGMGEENPIRIKLTEDLNNIHSSISSSLKNVKQTYNVTKKDLLTQASHTKSRISSAPELERGLIAKEREQAIKQNLFLFLMQKREETNLTIASTANKARIIVSPQEKTLPIAPKSQVILLASLILGFLLPIVVIYVMNLFKTQIKNKKELEALSDVSVIGQISRNEDKDPVIVQTDSKSRIAEAFRSLRNSLNWVLKNKGNKLILVTSSASGEGKTFISINLAVSFALSGKKALLIGGDIRNPRLAEYIKTTAVKGLSDYLVAEDSWKNYVNNSDLHDNLQLMTAGTIPPNPNELLMSPRLKEFLEEAKNEYDFVIVDTAPVGLVSDTYLMDESADVSLYVVREGVTNKAAVDFINAQKEEGKLINMYLVLNDSRSGGGYEYGYGGYGYGKYGYGGYVYGNKSK